MLGSELGQKRSVGIQLILPPGIRLAMPHSLLEVYRVYTSIGVSVLLSSFVVTGLNLKESSPAQGWEKQTSVGNLSQSPGQSLSHWRRKGRRKRQRQNKNQTQNFGLQLALAGGSRRSLVEPQDIEEPFNSRVMVLLANVMIPRIFLIYQSMFQPQKLPLFSQRQHGELTEGVTDVCLAVMEESLFLSLVLFLALCFSTVTSSHSEAGVDGIAMFDTAEHGEVTQ